MQADFSKLFARKMGGAAGGAPSSKPSGTSSSQSERPEASAAKKKKRKRKAADDAPADAEPAPAAPLPPSSSSSAAPVGSGGGKLQRQMAAQLAGAQFRYINEQLYTRPSEEAVALFTEEPELYEAYHEGFRSQAARWPQRPVQVIAEWLRRQPATHVVADLGCGDAELAASVPQRVHSFDLVAANPSVVACDIAAVPLADGKVHIAVFCLALMGSNFVDFLTEAHRLLKPRGILKIAEVRSRLDDIAGWDQLLNALGFDLVDHADSNTHFVLYEYAKSARPPQRDLPDIKLKACIYKRR